MSEVDKYTPEGIMSTALSEPEIATAEVAVVATGLFGMSLQELVHVDGVVHSLDSSPEAIAVGLVGYELLYYGIKGEVSDKLVEVVAELEANKAD